MQHMQVHPSLSLIRSCLPSVATAVEGRRAHVSQQGNNHKEILTSSVWHVPLTPARYTRGGKPTARDSYWCPFCKMDDFCGANKHVGVAQNPPSLHLLHWPCQWQTNSGGCEYTRNTDLHPLLMVHAMLTVMVTSLYLTPESPLSLHTTAFSGSPPCFPQLSSLPYQFHPSTRWEETCSFHGFGALSGECLLHKLLPIHQPTGRHQVLTQNWYNMPKCSQAVVC